MESLGLSVPSGYSEYALFVEVERLEFTEGKKEKKKDSLLMVIDTVVVTYCTFGLGLVNVSLLCRQV